MVEGMLRYLGGVAVEVASVGIHPKPVHPDAVRCMAEIGVDISGQRSKSVEPLLAERFDYVITLCDRTHHWPREKSYDVAEFLTKSRNARAA
jgi:protein-tyrosine-phosphatase